MNGSRISTFFFAVALLAGCGKLTGCDRAPAAPPAASDTAPKLPTKAQPKLPTMKLWLGAEELTVELARTPEQIMTGMMFRTNMAENEGMLFVFATPDSRSFWMKNCHLPLSLAYIDPEGTILEIRDMKPHDTTGIDSKTNHVQFVLEVNQGWFGRHHVTEGMLVRTERGTLLETFFRK